MIARRVLLACDLDSQVFGALPLALAFTARGWSTTFAIESVAALPHDLLERLARDFNVIERPIGGLPTDEVLFDHQAVGVFATGSRLAVFRHLLEIAARVKQRPRPALFCGFNGLVFEKFEEGLAWRLGYDVIGLNGPRDQDAFADFVHATDFEQQPSVIVGLRRKTDAPPRPLKIPLASHEPESRALADGPPPPDEDVDAAATEQRDVEATAEPQDVDATAESEETAPLAPESPADGPEAEAEATEIVALDEERPKTGTALALADPPATDLVARPRRLFVFAEQVVVPRGPRDRQNLVAILARLAAASPDWDVVIKARVRPNEKTFHQQTLHVASLVKDIKYRPSNLSVSYEPLNDLLEHADLFATISSTALFDAFDHGVPSMVSTDFGLRNADGAHVFFASGLLVQLGGLASLDDAPLRAPDERWLRRMGYGAPFSPDSLIDLLDGFDPSVPPPKTFVSFPTAAKMAYGQAGKFPVVNEMWNVIVASFAADEDAGEESRHGAMERRAALLRLGSALGARPPTEAPAQKGEAAAKKAPPPARKIKPPAVKRKKEGPIASFSRKIKMYWFYKRVRAKLGIPVT